MGWSAGLTFRKLGGVGMSGGSWRAERAMADCTSCAAPSMSRLRLNWSVMIEHPSELVEVICCRPGTCPNCFSNGAVIEEGGMLAAGGLLTPGKRIGRNELWQGSPARLARVMGADERARFDLTAKHYVELARRFRAGLAQAK